MDKGFRQFRVRVHGTLARIELLPEEMERMMEQPLRDEIYEAMKCIGFSLSHDLYNANLITEKNKLFQPSFGEFGKTVFLSMEAAKTATGGMKR